MTKADAAVESIVRDTLLIIASVVIILTGAKLASNLLTPFILSLFIAVLCGGPIAQLKSRGVPGWLASSLVGLGVLLIALFTLSVMSSSIQQFIDASPTYRKQFGVLIDQGTQWLSSYGIILDRQAISDVLNPADALGFLGGFIGGLGDTLSNLVLIIFTVVFLLADAPTFAMKLSLSEPTKHGRYLRSFQDLVLAMKNYMVTKALVSLLTGVFVWAGLSLLDVRFAMLWGFVAFLLNFIPNIGSIIAAVPPVLLSLLEFEPGVTLGIIVIYMVANTVMGNVIEPRWMGHRLGLSTLAVFLSLVFWGWMFGPVGMLLSVPLTMALKSVADQHPHTQWLSVLLSNDQALLAQFEADTDEG